MVAPTYAGFVLKARDLLVKSGLSESSASLEAKELLSFATGIDRLEYFKHRDNTLTAAHAKDLESFLARRLNGEPLAYILGEWDFYSRTFMIDKNVLIPRDDSVTTLTLFLSRLLLSLSENQSDEEIDILDLCAGSGCLGISAVLELLKKNLSVKCTLSDISDAALDVARSNIELHRLQDRVKTLRADALSATTEPACVYDGIICNPPYIKTGEIQGLDDSVKAFEPLLALDGGNDGLVFYRNISNSAFKALRPGGVLCFEAGAGQAPQIEAFMADAGFLNIEKASDLSGICRALCGTRPL